jgi:type VI secretion system protein ImpB
MAESKQHWLDRNRPPRVQITYDVETGGAIEKKEIPFVVGVLSDLSGDSPNNVPQLKDRKIIEVDRDNFDDFLKSIGPTVTVKPFVQADGKSVKIDPIKFEKIDDFHPDELVKQVTALKDLLDIRQKLNDLLAKADGNDDLIADLTKLVATVKVT